VTPRSTAVAVLVLAVLFGGVSGVVVDRSFLIPHHIGRRGPRGRPSWPGNQLESRDRFAHDLNLTSDQRVQFDTIMSRQVARFRAARERIQPNVDSIYQQTRAQLDSILTPAQRDQLHSMRARNAFGLPFPARGGRGERGDSSGRHRRFHTP
jgi:Spy/CpxP family protein refolding chaperone